MVLSKRLSAEYAIELSKCYRVKPYGYALDLGVKHDMMSALRHHFGIVNQNVLPLPASLSLLAASEFTGKKGRNVEGLSIPIFPPCASTASLQKVSPSPDECC